MGNLLKIKCVNSRIKVHKCPIYTHDGASAKFYTHSHETNYRVYPPRLLPFYALRREIFTVRGQSYFSRLPKYWPTIPLSTRRVCPPPATKAGGSHSPGGEGDGGSIFWKTREIGLPSYSNNLSTMPCVWGVAWMLLKNIFLKNKNKCEKIYLTELGSMTDLNGARLRNWPADRDSIMLRARAAASNNFIPKTQTDKCLWKVQSHQIRLGRKWCSWIGLHV